MKAEGLFFIVFSILTVLATSNLMFAIVGVPMGIYSMFMKEPEEDEDDEADI